MATTSLGVVCAWCNRTITAAPAGAAITHTICPACMEWAMVRRSAEAHPEKVDRFDRRSSGPLPRDT